jgi:hypothetical protein
MQHKVYKNAISTDAHANALSKRQNAHAHANARLMPTPNKTTKPRTHKTKQPVNQGLNLYLFRFSSTHHSDICTAFLTQACCTGFRSLRTRVLKSNDSTGSFS